MTIQKIGKMYVGRGHAFGQFFTAVGFTFGEVIDALAENIAVIRSLNAWN